MYIVYCMYNALYPKCIMYVCQGRYTLCIMYPKCIMYVCQGRYTLCIMYPKCIMYVCQGRYTLCIMYPKCIMYVCQGTYTLCIMNPKCIMYLCVIYPISLVTKKVNCSFWVEYKQSSPSATLGVCLFPSQILQYTFCDCLFSLERVFHF